MPSILVGAFAIGKHGSSAALCDDPVIKGNVSTNGAMIYHLPGDPSYNRTIIDSSAGERMFCTEDEARAAGWRKASR